MGKVLTVIIALTISYSCLSQLPASLYLEKYGSQLWRPTEITHAGDERLFVCDKFGAIYVIDSTDTKKTFLDIERSSSDGEGGILGLAFHPDYKQNGYFYVLYTDRLNRDRVSRFSVSANDPDVADLNSELLIIAFDQPLDLHHGGCLRFGPDGYLYISKGDAGDFPDQAQNGLSFLGKILRIDVDNGEPYMIPDDNPFIGNDDFLDEIWALGLRNPWKMSFDRETGDLWVTDVGGRQWEEINLIPAGTSGQNFGWPCLEGAFDVDLSGYEPLEYMLDCGSIQNFVAPVAGYPHREATFCRASITGGFVYRGLSEKLNSEAVYVFGDYCHNTINALVKNNNEYELIEFPIYVDLLDGISTFGEDVNGELYVGNYRTGDVYHLDFYCKSPEVDLVAVASCDSYPDGCIELNIPVNENISSAQILSSTGEIIPEEEYCSIPSGEYFIQTTSTEANCTRDLPFVVESITPVFYDRKVASDCRTNDGCVRIEIEQPYRDYVEVSLESSMGEVIDTSDYCQLYPDNYTVVIETKTNSDNCRAEFPMQIPFLNSSFVIEVLNGYLVAPDSFSIYRWYHIPPTPFDTLQFQAETTENVFAPQKIGAYRCFGYNEEGCEYRSRFASIFDLLAVADESPLELKVYPNPATEIFRIEADGLLSEELELSISDAAGSIIYQETISVQSNKVNHQLNLSELPRGIYFLKVSDKQRSVTKKLSL